jgi:hypothetical protein
VNVTISPLTEAEAKSFSARNQWLDHTRATAIHTCPRHGIVRYMHGKSLEVEGRQVPLECGNALHQSFAAHRVWQLWKTLPASITTDDEGERARVIFDTGRRIFGPERWYELAAKLYEDDPAPISLEALYTSGYIDDPRDRKRTLSNMELSLLHYLTRYPHDYLPFVDGEFVGIEVPVRLKLTFEDGTEFAYLGRADVILTEPRTGKLIVVDNKTSSNVANQWDTQWRTSHQLTGYCVGVSSMIRQRVMDYGVLGLQVPLPKGQEFGGYVFMEGTKTTRAVSEWAKWAHVAWRTWKTYEDTPFEAPMYTHSCYRYFRPCSFVPICDLAEDDPPMTLHEMTDSAWHPMGEDA